MSGFALAVGAKRLQASNRAPQCKLAEARARMVIEDQDALDFALSEIRLDDERPQSQRHFTRAWLVDLLKENGYHIGKTVVSDHLAGRCACGTSE